MALQRRGRPRDYFGKNQVLTRSEIHKLLVKELDARLIEDQDELKPKQTKQENEEQDMGLFDHLKGEIDTTKIEIDPFFVDDGVYVVAFAGCEIRALDGGDSGYEVSLDFKYQIVQDDAHDGKYNGKKISEAKWIPSEHLAKTDPEKTSQNLQFIFQRIAQLGVPEDKVEDVEVPIINEFIGTKYRLKYETLKKSQNDRQVIKWIRPFEEAEADDLI